MTQFCRQSVTGLGMRLWHLPQATCTVPPSSSAPWQVVQEARLAFAEKAWNPGLALSIQLASWPDDWTTPSRCVPPALAGTRAPAEDMVCGWQAAHRVRSPETAGWGDGGGTPWQLPQTASAD